MLPNKYVLATTVLLVFGVSLLNAQVKTNGYDARWKLVDSLVNKKGLTQSALEQVNKIYTIAKNEKNDAQLMKALVFRMNLQLANQEDVTQKNIGDLEKEIGSAQRPARSILTSMLAGVYESYLDQNRYKLYDRTKTIGYKKEDIATWGLADLHKKIGELYLASIKDERNLWPTRLEPFEPIIIRGNVRRLRPTLFDLLAHRALDYFKSDERDIDKPAYAFEINDPLAFAPLQVFASHSFRSADSFSLHFKALQLFQRLMIRHTNDASAAPLADLDIERVQFVYQYGVMNHKDSLYMKALAGISGGYAEAGGTALEPVLAQAWYLQAQQYANRAMQYTPAGDTANRYAYLQARVICEKIIVEKDSSEGKTNCQQLLQTILYKELSLQTEKVNMPGQPFRCLLSWRNFTNVYFRLAKVNRAQTESLGYNTYQDEYWTKLLQLPILRNFAQGLPETGDHQGHRVEIKVDALPPGEYALVASADKDFSLHKNRLSVQYFTVSAIAFVNYGFDYFVVNRESGQPLAGAAVQAWDQGYDNKTGRNKPVKAEVYQADPQGHFHMKEKKVDGSRQEQLLEISIPGDHLFLNDYVGGHYQYEPSKISYQGKTFFFTDRSIYRPGQTLYFKGIIVSQEPGMRQPKILSQFRTRVTLYDVNNRAIDSLVLTTNEYGSYHGKFSLPEHLLNGEFRLMDDSTGDAQTFSVEEYKRPRFFVDYEKLSGSYRPGDTVQIKGKAKAYAGNAIDGANVKYRVVRQARFPYPWLYRIRTLPVSTQEIAHGETRTNADGSYSIVFAALPDLAVGRDLDPVFEYRVSADITDINGETRSGETTVSVGYKTLELSINLPAETHLPADRLRELAVRTRNLSGEPELVTITMDVYKLKAPDRLIRERYWAAPDQFVASKEEWLSAFPHDEYRDELTKENWERYTPGTSYTLRADSLQPGLSRYRFSTTTLTPGWYAIEARAKDKFGQEVKDIRYIELSDSHTGQPANPQYVWASIPPAPVEPGERAVVHAGSSAGNIFVIRKLEGNSWPRDTAFQYFALDKGRKSTEFSVTEADRGGIAISDIFVKDNRYYTISQRVDVPWTNKELAIGYSSFRDKTLPGSEEKWQVKISGHKGEKVAAEVLAGMYDASLDQFRPHRWSKPDLYPDAAMDARWERADNFGLLVSETKYENDYPVNPYNKIYDQLLSYQLPPSHLMIRGMASPMAAGGGRGRVEKVNYRDAEVTLGYASAIQVTDKESNPDGSKGLMHDTSIVNESAPSKVPEQSRMQVRTNFAETAFFFPDLLTDSAGNISFSFTMPEALTRWKWMTLAHTRELAFAYSEKSVVTSKDLMVQPNAPRFLREGDRMELSAKVVNLSDKELTGQMELQLTDPTTNQSVDGWFSNRQANQYFTVGAGQSSVVGFAIEVPYQYNRPVTYRIVARAGSYSDGEEATLPVVSNRMLVTESLPLNLPGNGTRNFQFDKLLKSAGSETLNHHALTVEFSSNPSWYAVQALPYLMEYPYECAEQTFDRLYANALAASILRHAPRIGQIFGKWKTADTAALLSNLEKNQALKSVLLEETPWVLQAKSESQQKRNIALLFDMARMGRELESSLKKLQEMQTPGGGFVWFKGGPDDRYITQVILTGIGHLQKLDALPAEFSARINALVANALPYLDKKIKEDYELVKKTNKATSPGQGGSAGATRGQKSVIGLDGIQAQYLYMRSFFNSQGIPGDIFPAVNYYRKQAQQSWLSMGRYVQGMIALALNRTGDVRTAKEILASLRQNAVRDEEKGMYWKDMRGGYYWYQAPVETQSLLIEAFREIASDAAIDRDLKTWLLRQKQTRSWATTKATADACYALLMGGQNWLAEERNVSIRLGDKVVNSEGGPAGAEAGTGYFRKVFDAPFVSPSMGNISVTMSSGGGVGTGGGAAGEVKSSTVASGGPAWGAVYWQYFENLDRITPPDAGTAPLKLSKKIFVERNTDRGPVLEPVVENGVLHVGDKLKIRIELRSDRDLEYVHMKDMRASCTEPVNVLSGYKWQGGLGYYESTKDAGTDFFFSSLPRGTYVFEYPVFVAQNGNFSNGVTSIECMYAPEFGFHSEGIRVNVEAVNP